MPILYGVVARGSVILAKYASCAGNFAEVTDQILSKIPPENSKMSYSHGSYLFHYASEDGIIYMCITDDSQFGSRAQNALPFAMNSEFSRVLANQMKHFTDSKDVDTITKVQSEIDELKDVMVKNIDSIADRGERLELLVHKTENLSASSVHFRKTSRNLARSLFWKNIKLMVILGFVGIIIIYFIVSMACGGLAWQKCVK